MSENKLEKIRERCIEDPLFLATEVLGYKDLRESPHREVVDVLEGPHKTKKLVLMPRGSFKSSLVTVAYSIWSMIKDPNIRIMISCETQNNSRFYVGEIRSHLDSNPKFRALFGDWKNRDRAWRDDMFTISKRTRIIKEPTIRAVSLEKMATTGYHADLIIADDVVSPLNVNTPEQIQKTIDHYKLLLSILDPGKKMVVVGTRWHVSDLYGWIQDPNSGECGQFDVIVKPAEFSDGTLLLPHRLTKDFLEKAKATQGPYLFSCNYLNNPIASENQTFDPAWVRFFEKAPKGLNYFITLDPAISEDMMADYTAIIVNGVDHKNNWYIHEAIAKRMRPSETIDTIFQLAKRYQPLMCLAMEKFALERLLKVALIEEMLKRNEHIPIKEIQTDTRVSKEVRIRGLQPKMNAGQIYIRREHDQLYQQIIMHPQTKYDDLLDALKSQLSVAFPSDFVDDSEEKDYSHLPPRDRKEWEHVKKTRKVRTSRAYDY